MKQFIGEHLEFLKQFRDEFHSTGAIAPSSRFVARALTGPFEKRTGPLRVLEIGPGTGAITRHIVNLLGPDDRLDLVELNEKFVAMLRHRLEHEPEFRAVADRVHLHSCAIQDFQAAEPYDFIISGLPINNFPADLVEEIFSIYFKLLAPHGQVSYFEYMYVRPLRRLVSGSSERKRLRELDRVISPYLHRHRVRRNWIFVNLPPAWVQHLRPNKTVENGVHAT